jgi:hypothetical protein
MWEVNRCTLQAHGTTSLPCNATSLSGKDDDDEEEEEEEDSIDTSNQLKYEGLINNCF